MEAKSRGSFAIAISLALLFGAGWLLFGRGTDPAPTPVAAAPQRAAEQPGAAAAAAIAPPSPSTAPTPDAAPPAAPQRTAAPAPTPDKPTTTLRGRCVDAQGAPLAGCTVDIHGWECNSQRMAEWMREHAEKPEWQDPPAVTTGVDGQFEFTFWPPPPFQFALDVTHDGDAGMSGRWSRLAPHSVTDVGDVVMQPGVKVVGRVVDGSGAPQAKEYVTLQCDRNDRGAIGPRWGAQVVSKADGTFNTSGWLAPGEYRVTTQKFELQSPKTVTLSTERPVEEISVVVVQPPATATIRGRVLDETGAPVSGVEIEDRGADRQMSTTSSRRDGTFELRRREPGEEKNAVLVLSSYDCEIDEASARREVPWGATDVEFRVVRAPALTLRVTDSAQAPVETYTVILIPRNRSRWSSSDARTRAQGKHEDGTVVVPGLTRGDWLLLVDFPQASGLDSLFVSFHQDGGPRRMDLRATVPARRMLRVVAGDETPIAGTKVQLCDPFGTPLDNNRLVMRRDHWLMNSGGSNALVLFEGATGPDGRVELRGPGDRELAVCVLGPGHVPSRQSGLRLDGGSELVVHVSRGARLVGRIVPPEALAELKRLAGVEGNAGFAEALVPKLGLSGAQGRRFPKDHVTGNDLTSLRIADDGSFDAIGLPTGFWKVEIEGWMKYERGAHSRTFPGGEVQLIDDVTTTQDLDLSYVLPGTLEGLVLLNGQPLANENVALIAPDHQDSAHTDAEGRFRQQVFAGDYRVQVNHSLKPRVWSSLRCPSPARVVRGQTTSQTFAIASATLRVTVLDAAGKPVAGVSLQALGDDKDAGYMQPTDAAGVAQTELVPGTVTLRVLPKALLDPKAQAKLWQEAQARGDSDPFGPHWLTLQTVTLQAGQPSEVEVRLPASAGY